MAEKLLTLLTTYCLIILCEMGDKTQLAVLLLASNNSKRRWLIYAASAIALTLCVILEVTAGVALRKYIGPALFNRATGFVFLLIGAAALWEGIRAPLKQER
ncbi:MAG: TMEM165/GDT1 family protein [Thermacetogeniaceae bacterium]